jgi:putative ABC transport system ATP-binding protein
MASGSDGAWEVGGDGGRPSIAGACPDPRTGSGLPSPGAILEACGIGRRRPDGPVWLLHRVSLEVRPGECLVIAGPSGSGKTLLLRALALLDPIDSGQVLWRGCPVQDREVPAFRRRVIYLHQRPALLEGSVEDNFRYPYTLKVHRRSRYDRRRIVGYLAELGRDGAFLAKSHRDLSGGEAQVVALLRAIQLNPEVLLLDEPTSALDAEATRAVEALLGLWRAEAPQARSLVWITHDADQSRRVADRALGMQSGLLGSGA